MRCLWCRSPFQFGLPDSEAGLMKPSVQGTEAVFRSVARHKDTVSRVVLTSSVAGGCCLVGTPLLPPCKADACARTAVHDEYGEPPKSGGLYTEQDFNETSTIESRPYHLSKVSHDPCALLLC